MHMERAREALHIELIVREKRAKFEGDKHHVKQLELCHTPSG